jgi:hypothetical protein
MRRSLVATVSLAFALALTGCGADAPAAAPSAKPSMDPHERGVRFAQCMREHGVDVPDPEPGKGMTMKFDGSVSRETVDKAMEACREWAPQGLTGGGTVDPKQDEAMRKLSQCMRDNGVEAFPDPEGGGIRMGPEAGNDPDFKAAEEKCKQLRPGS